MTASTHLIEVAFAGNRKGFYQWAGEAPPSLQAAVIVDADRGEDLGHVHATGELAETRCRGCSHGCGTAPLPTDRALRLATAADLTRAATLSEENDAARRTTHERARAAGLHMKISDAEWQWDRRKLTIYFTAERRIDFRALVRELASLFRTRIELKQIGVRDEAKRLSGIGRCGREYCSSSWLPELLPVNLGVAKDQKLSLNPTQISGACGRLMCCLRYEHEFYVQSRRRFPKEGKILRTRSGEEKVMTCDIFRDTVTLRSPDGEVRIAPLAELRAEVEAAGGGPLSASSAAPAGPAPGPGKPVDTPVRLVARADPATGAGTVAVPPSAPAQPAAPTAARATPAAPASPVAPTSTTPTPPSTPVARGEAESSPPKSDDDSGRRKRRRGRRGGRRLRNARENGGNDPSTPPSTND